MIAKLIAYADTREAAIETLSDACAEVQIWPVKSNAGFLVRLLGDSAFRTGDVDTELIARGAKVLDISQNLQPSVLAGRGPEAARREQTLCLGEIALGARHRLSSQRATPHPSAP